MILNFDATFAKAITKATDVVAAVVMTAPVNQRMSLVNLVLVMIANVDARVARETANLERVKTKPRKHPKMISNFDATFAKAITKATGVVAAVVMTTALENQRMLLAHLRMSP